MGLSGEYFPRWILGILGEFWGEFGRFGESQVRYLGVPCEVWIEFWDFGVPRWILGGDLKDFGGFYAF